MSRVFTTSEIQFLKDHANGRKFSELTDMLNQAFGKAYRPNQVKCACYDRGIKNGLSGGFQKGHKIGIDNKWGFSCGDKPHNFCSVGTEVIDRRDGYIRVKISDNPPIWKAKHIVLWETLHGHIPHGHKVIFADGNKGNFAIDNLILVSSAELMVMNRKGYIFDDAELTKAGYTVAKVTVKIHKKEKFGVLCAY